MGLIEEPILSRLDRLDIMLRQLEEIRSCSRSPKSSCASTASSGTLTSEGRVSSIDFSPRSLQKHSHSFDHSPKSLEKHCRPIDRVIMETEVKGTLIDRLDHVEERMLKLCSQLQKELEMERKRQEKMEKKAQKKGIRKFVKECVKF